MQINRLIQKLDLYKKNPDIVQPLTPSELADLVIVVLDQVKVIDQAIKEGRLDGYTPEPDKDYLSKETAIKMLREAVADAITDLDRNLTEKGSVIEQQVRQALDNIRDGEDGADAEITPEQLQLIAEQASNLIKLPDVSQLFNEQLADLGYALNEIETLRSELQIVAQTAAQAASGGGVRGNPRLHQIKDLYIQDTDPGNVPDGSIWIDTA